MASVGKNHSSGFDSVKNLQESELLDSELFRNPKFHDSNIFSSMESLSIQKEILFPTILTSRGRSKDSNAVHVAKGLLSIESIISWKGGGSNVQS